MTFAVGVAGLALSLHVATGARSQSAAVQWRSPNSQQRPAASNQTAEQVYQNIQVLTGLPATELDGVMEFMSAAMGVGCTHCHTNSWASDRKSTKLATRKMIVMTRNLNKESFSGNPAITCYSCHRGQHNTEPQPPIDIAVSPAPDVTLPAKSAALPSTSEVVERYIRAIGGEAAIERLKTRVSRGAETTTNRMTPPRTLPIEILQAEPNKLLIIRSDPLSATTEGFDGVKGWSKDARGQHEMTGKELAVTKREADFFRYLKIRESYPQMRVLAKEKIRDREAYVVGATSREDDRERLFFDAQSGLLVRSYVSFKTAFGSIPEVTDFDDYREVSGVKLPFTIKWSRPPFGFVRKFTGISLNAIVDGARFQPEAR
ncbi:MAG TPA: photosynthetic reaction center cytochrome c subunit family protein [Blastocatellia bacterium]|nr:photosynthetic reaction center cytochrome c subunit family protein [Blastocatellia bacterium]